MNTKQELILNHQKGGGLGLGWKYREPVFYGGLDTETVNGMPYTLQIADQTGRREIVWLYGNARIARNVLYDILDKMPDKSISVFGFYFFKYDVQVLLRDHPELFTGLASLGSFINKKGEKEYDFSEDGYTWSGVITWPTVFVIIRRGSRVLLLIDLFRFYEGGLARVAVDLKLPFKKFKTPACVKGAREPKGARELKQFNAYAIQDAVVALSILETVKQTHEEFQLSWSLSNAHMFWKIFKKNFTVNPKTRKAQGLDVPDYFMQINGLKSYHGGRNSLTVPRLPFRHSSIKVYDVNSMYPYVGTILPGFFSGTWCWSLQNPVIRPNGIYCISGYIKRGSCFPYQLIMSHGGNYLPVGGFQKVWITGIEILTAFKYKILEIKDVWGFEWEKGDSDLLPFKNYFEHYYKEKASHKDIHPVLYHRAKVAMNTIYGKLAACIPHQERNEDGTKNSKTYLTPGGAFNSPIASLFTAHSRCIIFEAEVEYGSFQSATDAIYISGPNYPKESKRIGEFSLETTGELVVGRNKLYAVISHDGKGSFTGFKKEGEKKVWYWEGRKILKYALHAFMGTPIDFLNACLLGKTEYTYSRMGNLKESLKRPDIVPLTMNKLSASVNWGGKYGPMKLDDPFTGEIK